MAGNYQEYTTRIFLNDEQAQDKINNLRKSIERYKKEKQDALSAGKDGDKAWKEADRNIKAAEAEMRKLSTTSQQVNHVLNNLSTSSVKDLRLTIKAINKELSSGSITRNSAEWNALNAQLKKARTELAGIQAESAAVSGSRGLSGLADGINRYWGLITQFVAGIAMLTLSIRKSTQAYADIEEAMANVRKYTGQTTEEVHAMNEEFKKIDTRTQREDLNKFAGAAGRLGITAHDAIMEFVDVSDKINVALGDDLGADAVETIGKMAMAFGEDEKLGLRGAMLATGSAVNELSQNSAASANYLVEFTARLAGIGQVAGMTQAQIMSLASVMDENMQNPEMAATAMSNLIAKLATDSSKFAKIAGIDVKEFAELVEHDMNGALLKFAKTLQGKGGLMKLAPMFNDMGLDGSRAVGVLTVLANKVDDVRKNQEIANKAYDEATSIIKEFNVQNNTVQADIDKNVKTFKELAIMLGERLLPVVKYTISGGSLLVKVLYNLIEFSVKYRATIITLTVAYVALNAQKLKDIALSKLQLLWNNYLLKGLKNLYALLIAHPYVAVAAAIATVIALFADWSRATDNVVRKETALAKANKTATEEYAEQAAVIDSLTKIFRDNNNTLTVRNDALEKLKKIIPGYNAELTKEGKIINDNNDAIKRYLTNLERQIKLKAAQEELENAYKSKRLKEKEITKDEANLKRAEEGTSGAIYGGDAGAEAARSAYSRVMSADKALRKAKAELININKDINELTKEINLSTVENATKTAEEVQITSEAYVSEKKIKQQQIDNKRNKIAADKAERAALNQHLAELSNMYGKGMITYSEFLEKQKSMQLDSIKKRKAIWGEESNEAKQLADDEIKIMQRHDEKRIRQKDIEIERERATTEAKLNAMFYDINSEIYMNEDALNEALFRNDMEALDKMMAARNAGSEQWQQLRERKELMEQEHKYSNEIDYQKKLSSMREEFGEHDSQQQMQIALNGLEEIHKRGIISEEEYQKILLHIRGEYATGGPGTNNERFNEDVEAILATAKAKAGDVTNPEEDSKMSALFKNDINNWKNVNEQIALMEEQGVINHAQANAAKARNDSEYLDTLLSRTQMIYSMVNNVMSAAAAYSKACSDIEAQNIEKSYERQIKAVGKNSKKRQQLEEKRDKEIRKARNKANAKAVKIEIAQAIATSAMSALDAYASVIKAIPYPANMALAPVAAGMALAAGALQIATIKKQHEAQKEGYYKGGFTRGNNYHTEAGVVHQGEFVANHNAVNNAAILPALQLIDTAQRNNTVASITAEDISRAVGTSTAAAPIVNIIQDAAQIESLRQTQMALLATMSEVQRQLQEGIYAYTTIDGEHGIAKQLAKFQKLKKRI